MVLNKIIGALISCSKCIRGWLIRNDHVLCLSMMADASISSVAQHLWLKALCTVVSIHPFPLALNRLDNRWVIGMQLFANHSYDIVCFVFWALLPYSFHPFSLNLAKKLINHCHCHSRKGTHGARGRSIFHLILFSKLSFCFRHLSCTSPTQLKSFWRGRHACCRCSNRHLSPLSSASTSN